MAHTTIATTQNAPHLNSSPSRQRTHRCRNCTDRKFRTARDLALHILSKHGHAHVPITAAATDDARSVTQSSPPIRARDMNEIDRLLAATLPTPPPTNSKKSKLVNVNATCTDTRSVSMSMSLRTRRRVQPMRKRRVTTPWFTTIHDNSPAFDDLDQPVPTCTNTQEGESVGPLATDVYLNQCRAGHIPLIPISPKPAEMLNFASGLF